VQACLPAAVRQGGYACPGKQSEVGGVVFAIRVQQRLQMLHVPADSEMMIIDQKEENVQADKPLMVFTRLVFTSSGKNPA